MPRTTLKFLIITIILLFSVQISSQDVISSSVFDLTTDPSYSKIDLQGIDASSFVSAWDTRLTSQGSSNSFQIGLPLSVLGNYDFTIDWGDGTPFDTITAYNQAEANHTYASEGIYTLVINGTLEGWHFQSGSDMLKIIEISQWGDLNLGITGMNFLNCENLVLTATDAPDLTGVTILIGTFMNCSSLGSTGSLEAWDISGITILSGMFFNAITFNQPLGNWDVSSVTDMSAMFYNASAFNQPLNNWDLKNARIIDAMFAAATSFNQPLDNWNISRVNGLLGMFMLATTFNQPLDTWDVSNVTNMWLTFFNASSFNQPLSNWDVANVTEMDFMFANASSFDQPIGNWDVSSVTDMQLMFDNVTLSPQNYDDLLNGWATLALQSNVNFDGGFSKYTNAAATSRQYIIDTFTWTVTDGGWTEITPPDVSGPDDFSYNFGSTGHEIIWTLGDANPGVFNITLNGMVGSTQGWVNDTILLNVDALNVGTYEFIIYVYDSYGNMASDAVIVTVVDPTAPDVSSPDNLFYEQGSTGNQILWTLGDASPDIYNVTLDGSFYAEDTWINGTIALDINGLGLGIHEFIIFVYDSTGNWASDAVTVVVIDIFKSPGLLSFTTVFR